MRTTLTIDDDVLSAAQEMAQMENRSVGEVISALARRSLAPSRTAGKTRNDVPLLKPRKGAPRVTSELVQRLREELL
jgi:predicted CopG family antitoxin